MPTPTRSLFPQLAFFISLIGTATAEATLEANGIQDLAEQIPGITMAAVGSSLKFNIRIELGGDDAPGPAVVDAINVLLSTVSEDLKLH